MILLRDIIVALLVSIIFYVSGLLTIFTPLPIVYVFVTRGRGSGIVAALLAIAVLAFMHLVLLPRIGDAKIWGLAIPLSGIGLSGVLPGSFFEFIEIGYFVFFVAIAIALGEGGLKRLNLVPWGFWGLVSGLFVVGVMALTLKFVDMGQLAGGLEGYLAKVFNDMVAANVGASIEGGGADFIKEHAGEIVAFALKLAPSMIFVFALLVVVVNMLIGRRLIHKNRAFAHIHNVARFRLPDFVVWAMIICGAGFFFDHYVHKIKPVELIAINGLICLGSLYFFQGLAVTVYFLQGIRMPFLKMAAYLAVIFFFQTIAMFIMAVGVADVWVDFRLRHWHARRMKT